jgi:hypothetical protein
MTAPANMRTFDDGGDQGVNRYVNPWMPGALPLPPGLYRPGGPAARAAEPVKVSVAVTIKADLPPGVSVAAASGGDAKITAGAIGRISPMPAWAIP